MSLFHKYNNENILVRAVIAGMLNILNNKIKYNQVWADDDIETIEVPWFYNQSGDERFMQDFYTHYKECLPPRPVDGNFDMIPRGVITYTGSGIDEQRITSRYVQGKYVKESDGQLNAYVSYLYSLPLTIRFDAELWIDTEITALKIEQEIREAFYKTITYYVYYKGMRVGCTAGFPADLTIDKKINYSFESDNQIKLTFSLEVETYQPVFDPTTEMLADKKINKLAYRLHPDEEDGDGNIEVTSPNGQMTIPKGIPLKIEWSVTREEAIVNSIDLYWVNFGENERFEIALQEPNHEFYIWYIPEDFTEYKEPTIIWEEQVGSNPITVSRQPLLKIIPNLTTKKIDDSSFHIFDDGYFYTLSDDVSINIQLEMKDDSGQITYTNDGDIWGNIKYNKLDSVEVNPDASIYFPGTVDYKRIDIHVANTVNNDVFGIVNDIKIV